jgi:hypothetical protein
MFCLFDAPIFPSKQDFAERKPHFGNSFQLNYSTLLFLRFFTAQFYWARSLDSTVII